MSKKKAKKIPETVQMPLLDRGSTAPESCSEGALDGDFINPSPHDIFFGDRRLGDYLNECGMGWVIRLRQLLEESDLSEFESRYRGTGRKAIHPVAILGLIVYGIIDGKWSLRGLESLASRDLGAMWVCGGLRPDHSTIGNFINRFGDILTEKYFIELTRMLIKKLRIPASDVAGDGTVIEAAANRFKSIKAEAVRQAAAKAKERASLHPDDEMLQKEAREARGLANLANNREAKVIKQNRRDPKKLKISTTDPEAVFQTMKNKTTRPSYKPSVLANSERLIVGQHVDPSDENVAVRPMLEQHRSVVGELPGRAMFDAGYHNMTVLSLSVELDIDVLCPSTKADNDEWDRKLRAGKFDKSNFVYNHDDDVYICPAGEKLKRKRKREKHGTTLVEYGGGKSCNGCELRSQCTSAKDGRTVERYEVDELKEAMAKVFENEGARKTYSQRKAIVEPVFAQMRERQGLNRFHRRGLKKVSVEFSLHCIAYNLKRAIRLEAGGVFCLILARKGSEFALLGLVILVEPSPKQDL